MAVPIPTLGMGSAFLHPLAMGIHIRWNTNPRPPGDTFPLTDAPHRALTIPMAGGNAGVPGKGTFALKPTHLRQATSIHTRLLMELAFLALNTFQRLGTALLRVGHTLTLYRTTSPLILASP